MTRIGILSDTHGWLDPAIFRHFETCDEIWHAGDFGSVEVSDALAAFKPLKGVYGNIDGHVLRRIHPEFLSYRCENVSVLMTHIGGYPGHYAPAARLAIEQHVPKLFICGHSHILRVMRDSRHHNMLVMNPGAAGREGFHKVRTCMRFAIDGERMLEAEVIELGKRGAYPQT